MRGGFFLFHISKTSVNRRNQLVASITHLLEELNEYCLIGLDLVKFPHDPILHYTFSSWKEKTMTKTVHWHWENRFVLYIGA